MDNYKYLLQDLTKLKGVGNKTSTILKRKKINFSHVFLVEKIQLVA